MASTGKSETYSKDFTATVQTVTNGFLLHVNNLPYVIQSEGDRGEDFEKLVRALRVAFNQVYRLGLNDDQN